MEFFINKGSTLPILTMEVLNNGENNYSEFFNNIQNATIVFTMKDLATGAVKIGRKPGLLIPITPQPCTGDEFYIGYQFDSYDTNTAGKYMGQFEITFLDGSGKLIVPIVDQLYINIMDKEILK